MLPVAYRDEFLEVLMETGNVAEAARRLGIARLTAYQWKWSDANYSDRWDSILETQRESLRERVVETACLIGLAKPVPARDAKGDLILDDDFEPVMTLDVSEVDPRILMKLMDKTLRDEVRRVDQHSVVEEVSPWRPVHRPRPVLVIDDDCDEFEVEGLEVVREASFDEVEEG